MRKLLVILAIVVISVSLLSACKSTEKCPAYTQAETEHADQAA